MKNKKSNDSTDKLEMLYHKYRKLMYKEAFKVLKDASLAEDAIHQSFIKIMSNMHKIGEVDDNKTKNYLVIICRNTAIDMQKKKLYLNQDADILDYETTDDEGLIDFVEPSQVVINKETVNVVAKAIADLPDIYRDVLLLEKVYDYSKEEIAKLLNVSYENVRKRSQRARKMLLEALEKEAKL